MPSTISPPTCDLCGLECPAGEVVVLGPDLFCGVCGYRQAALKLSKLLAPRRSGEDDAESAIKEAIDVHDILHARILRKIVGRRGM